MNNQGTRLGILWREVSKLIGSKVENTTSQEYLKKPNPMGTGLFKRYNKTIVGV